ncbi:MAG: hypoxanthine phosphoribosyltransferase [Ureaplasma sp.]|nr:hypoxanthine phosphoribosyltransferase [Ureaplasma sp.]MDE7222115.1 hypoxanthine phosphoribosyltransferase [Ureaplasma sp.]
MKKDNRIFEILISARQIKKGIKNTAKWLNKEYKGKTPIIIGVLKGCIPFIGQISTLLNFDFELDFMSASSFKGGTNGSNDIKISLDLTCNIKDRDVIILEDIIDTARTLKKIIELLKARKPKSIRLVTLLDKTEGRKVELNADYSCFTIPNKFIVGFGLDYKEIMRNYNFIGCLKPECIESNKTDKKGKSCNV